MASLFAVVLAGIPTRIYGDVSRRVAEKFPDVMVLRGEGTKLYSSGLAIYSEEYVATLLSNAADAVFGASRRPRGFCRLPHRECAKNAKAKNECGNDNGQMSCGRRKPEYLFLAYQESSEADEQRLLEEFYFAPAVIRIPKEHYDKKTMTVDAIISGLVRALTVSTLNMRNATGGSPSVLLPPKTFGRKELRRLLWKAVKSGITKEDYRAFRAQFFEFNYFKGKARTKFKAATGGAAHGLTGAQAADSFALSRHYRAGCSFRSDFHWDVSLISEEALRGRVELFCRVKGQLNPSGDHVNFLPDDCLRGA